MLNEKKQIIKLVIIGDTDVGKTCIATRYSTGQFDSSTSATVGAACIEKEVTFDGQQYLLSMWDTAGQETYRNLVPMYFRNAEIAFIVFDVTNPKTSKSIGFWIQSLNDNCQVKPIILLAANKCDLEAERKIDSEDVQKLGNDFNIPYFETSAKTGYGIAKLFESAFSEYLRKSSSKTDISEPVPNNNNKGCC